MSSYHFFLLTLLCIGGALNLYQPRVLTLVFVTALFLLFLSSLIPPANVLQNTWFKVLIQSEAFFAACALLSFSTAGRIVAAFCLWNIASHVLGWVSFVHDYPAYTLYSPLIRAGEVCQALALILFSQPIINLAVWFRTKDRSTDDEWHRLEHGTR
jgi:hypothetical protein